MRAGTIRAAFAAAILWPLMSGVHVLAQGLDGFIQFNAVHSDIQTESEVSGDIQLETFAFVQRYNLNLHRYLLRTLQFQLGGQFEWDQNSDLGDEPLPDSSLRRLQPYLHLIYRLDMFSANLDLYRNDQKTESGDQGFRSIRDAFNTTIAWRPEKYPYWRLRFGRTHDFDATREIRDSLSDLIALNMEWNYKSKLQVVYRGGIEERTDQLRDTKDRLTVNTARASYADSYANGRMQFAAEYLINHNRQEVLETGDGSEIDSPVFAANGLSTITEVPEEIVLQPNPALNDDNVFTPAGVNLGVVPPGGDDRGREMGLDFGGPSTVNLLKVWIDREIELVAANSFVWQIYTSSDNQFWELRQTVSQAQYLPFDRRFELRFDELTSRYIKAVTLPLDPSVPTDDDFPEIWVTEVDGVLRQPASEFDPVTSQTSHLVNTNLRARLMRSKALFYEFNYSGRKIDDGRVNWEMTNNLALQERLSRLVSMTARVGRQDFRQSDAEAVTYPYSVSFRANWLPTFRQTLTLGGRRSEFDGAVTDENSIFLLSGAELYRGVRTDLSLGTAYRAEASGRRVVTPQGKVSARISPHRTLSFNLQYNFRRTDATGGTEPDRLIDTAFSRIAVSFVPFPALYFSGSYRLEQTKGAKDRITRSFSVSWSPLPGGSLQIGLPYIETFRTELDTLFRVFSPRIRWHINNRSWLEATWERSMTDSDLSLSERDVIRVSMRIGF